MIVGAVVVVAVLGAGVWFFFIRSDAPPEVDLDSATEQVTSTTGRDAKSTTTTTEEPHRIEGTWVVDNESGQFDFESATGSFAGYRVEEELASIGTSEAVGRTGAVDGTMVIEGTVLESAEVTVDMSGLESDKPRRDNRVQEALGTDEFPEASFELTKPVELGPQASAGEDVSVDASGELTINGVTNEVTVELDAQLVDDTAVVVGSIPITLADYDIEAPSAPVVLSVSDEATIEFQLLFTRPAGTEPADRVPSTTRPTTAPTAAPSTATSTPSDAA